MEGYGMSLKNIRTATVNTGLAPNFDTSFKQNLRFCPAGASENRYDDFGRYVKNPLAVRNFNDPACSQFVYSVGENMNNENYGRPYISAPAPGNRNYGDRLGVHRDNQPANLYGEGHQFKRSYFTGSDYQPSPSTPYLQNNLYGVKSPMDLNNMGTNNLSVNKLN